MCGLAPSEGRGRGNEKGVRARACAPPEGRGKRAQPARSKSPGCEDNKGHSFCTTALPHVHKS